MGPLVNTSFTFSSSKNNTRLNKDENHDISAFNNSEPRSKLVWTQTVFLVGLRTNALRQQVVGASRRLSYNKNVCSSIL